jgi:hypothetical protein
VSDELERRLRDSLRAYADLVDEPESRDLPTGTAPPEPRAALRGWRGAVLGAAAAAAVVSWSFWVVTSDGDRPVAAGSDAASVASRAEAASGSPEGDTLAADAAAGAPGETQTLPPSLEVGAAYPLDLYTHCGVLGLDVGGVWFAADPPLVEGAGNPPAGWGNPYQRGTLTLVTTEEAVFADGAGHDVRLVADDPARPGPCD